MDPQNIIFAIFAWLLTTTIQQVSSIVAYDCGTTTSNVSLVSLVNIKKCEIPLTKPVTQSTQVQLLQMTEFNFIKVIQCKIEIHRSVYYCGHNSHIALVTNSHIQYIEETSHEKCKKLHETGSYVIHNKVFMGIKINETESRTTNFAGQVTESGWCKGTDFSDHYGSWNYVVVVGQVFFSAYEYLASVKINSDEIILRSGVRCTYSKGECMDIEGGNTFWNIVPESQCRLDSYAVLYQGNADKIKDNSIKQYGKEIYSFTSEQVTFALTATGYAIACGHKLIKTEHPRLFIIDKSLGDYFMDLPNRIATSNMELFTYVNAKFVYFEHYVRQQLIALYNDVIRQECELENKILKNSLTLAASQPAEFAYNYMDGPGYMAHVAGEVIRITKCVPTEVIRRPTLDCFQELPVSRGNISLYMLPRTHILVKTGTQIDCDSFLAPMYNINSAWYRVTPNVVAVHNPPEELSAQTKLSWSYEPPSYLATSGIYTSDDLRKFSQHIMNPVEKPAIINTIARSSISEDTLTQGITLDNLINEQTIKSKLDKAWGKIFVFFNKLGTVAVTLTGVYTFFVGIKLILNTIMHGYALYKVFGLSFWLIGAIWGSLTNVLLHREHTKTKDKNGTDTEENKTPKTHQEQTPEEQMSEVVINTPIPTPRGAKINTPNPLPRPQKTILSTTSDNRQQFNGTLNE